MNVYVRELSRELSRRGIAVDVYTRSENPGVPHINDADLGPHARVIHVPTGPEEPMQKGVIADYLITEAMLRYFISKVVGRINIIRPEVMVCVPAGVTSVEQRAVRDAAVQAGARQPANLVPEPLAAAIGARIPVGSPSGNMVVDIGGGRTEAAVISMYGIVVSDSVRVAGDRMDDAIAAHIKRRHNLIIGERTAEDVKIAIGSAIPLEENPTLEVRGRD